MSPQREKELEQLLRRLRQRAFDCEDADPHRCERVERLMLAVKRRLQPLWDRRAAHAAYLHSEKMLKLWA